MPWFRVRYSEPSRLQLSIERKKGVMEDKIPSKVGVPQSDEIIESASMDLEPYPIADKKATPTTVTKLEDEKSFKSKKSIGSFDDPPASDWSVNAHDDGTKVDDLIRSWEVIISAPGQSDDEGEALASPILTPLTQTSLSQHEDANSTAEVQPFNKIGFFAERGFLETFLDDSSLEVFEDNINDNVPSTKSPNKSQVRDLLAQSTSAGKSASNEKNLAPLPDVMSKAKPETLTPNVDPVPLNGEANLSSIVPSSKIQATSTSVEASTKSECSAPVVHHVPLKGEGITSSVATSFKFQVASPSVEPNLKPENSVPVVDPVENKQGIIISPIVFPSKVNLETSNVEGNVKPENLVPVVDNVANKGEVNISPLVLPFKVNVLSPSVEANIKPENEGIVNISPVVLPSKVQFVSPFPSVEANLKPENSVSLVEPVNGKVVNSMGFNQVAAGLIDVVDTFAQNEVSPVEAPVVFENTATLVEYEVPGHSDLPISIKGSHNEKNGSNKLVGNEEKDDKLSNVGAFVSIATVATVETLASWATPEVPMVASQVASIERTPSIEKVPKLADCNIQTEKPLATSLQKPTVIEGTTPENIAEDKALRLSEEVTPVAKEEVLSHSIKIDTYDEINIQELDIDRVSPEVQLSSRNIKMEMEDYSQHEVEAGKRVGDEEKGGNSPNVVALVGIAIVETATAVVVTSVATSEVPMVATPRTPIEDPSFTKNAPQLADGEMNMEAPVHTELSATLKEQAVIDESAPEQITEKALDPSEEVAPVANQKVASIVENDDSDNDVLIQEQDIDQAFPELSEVESFRDIEMGDDDPQTRASTISSDEKYDPFWKNQKFLLIALVFLVAVIGAVVGAIIATSGSGGSSISSSSSKNVPPLLVTPSPTLSPSQSLLSLITGVAIRKGAEFVDPDSYQSHAYNWLAKNFTYGTYSDAQLVQRYSLACLYFSTDLETEGGWNLSTEWLSYLTACDWFGIVCNAAGDITALNLGSNNLVGELPAEVSLLTTAYLLWFDFNNGLTGTIPTEVATLPVLQSLSLQGCSFSGTIPTEFGRLTNLYSLRLNSNYLTGSIPSSLGNLLKVQILLLNSNLLTGNMPAMICANRVNFDTAVAELSADCNYVNCTCCTSCW